MKILLDENVPVQATAVLERTLRAHEIHHVETFRRGRKTWKGKLDKFLLPELRPAGFDVFITKDRSQLSDPDETRMIKAAGVHHVRFEQKDGLKAFARAVGAVIAAMPGVMEHLSAADSQCLVRIRSLDARRQSFDIVDPRRDPPPYWR